MRANQLVHKELYHVTVLTFICYSVCVYMLSERAAITTWIKKDREGPITSPLTNEIMGPKLIPNTIMRTLIRSFVDKHHIKM